MSNYNGNLIGNCDILSFKNGAYNQMGLGIVCNPVNQNNMSNNNNLMMNNQNNNSMMNYRANLNTTTGSNEQENKIQQLGLLTGNNSSMGTDNLFNNGFRFNRFTGNSENFTFEDVILTGPTGATGPALKDYAVILHINGQVVPTTAQNLFNSYFGWLLNTAPGLHINPLIQNYISWLQNLLHFSNDDISPISIALNYAVHQFY